MQAGEQRRERGRPADHDAKIPLERFRKTGAAQHFGEQTFRRQEHDPEVRRRGRAEILAGNFAALQADALHQREARGLGGGGVARLLRLDETLIFLVRKFRVDRQPHRRAIRIATRQADRELDALRAAFVGGEVAHELIGRQRLLQQIAKLHLAPGAARFHVAEDLLQVAHADGQRLHFAEAAVDLFEPFAHELEGFAEPLFERRVQLLIHRGADAFELRLVVALHLRELRLDRRAHRFELRFTARGEFGKLLLERVRQVLQLPGEQFAESLQRRLHLLPGLRFGGVGLRETLIQIAPQRLHLRARGFAEIPECRLQFAARLRAGLLLRLRRGDQTLIERGPHFADPLLAALARIRERRRESLQVIEMLRGVLVQPLRQRIAERADSAADFLAQLPRRIHALLAALAQLLAHRHAQAVQLHPHAVGEGNLGLAKQHHDEKNDGDARENCGRDQKRVHVFATVASAAAMRQAVVPATSRLPGCDSKSQPRMDFICADPV